MSKMYVAVEALNFRRSPEVTAGNRIGTVFLGQELEKLDDEADGWVSCRAILGGNPEDGFVAGRFLRQPLSPEREALVASVHREYMRFARGLGKEHIAPFSGFVGEMWQAIGLPHLDGTDRDVPWSAAAISFMVRNAGPQYANFRFAAAHSKYTHQAIRARLAHDRSVPFWGFRLDEVQPRIGDIVARDNPSFGPEVSFDIAANLDAYRSHTDIVMQIDSENQILRAIGGNVGHSVDIARYDLAPGDFLASTKNVFAILRNITDE